MRARTVAAVGTGASGLGLLIAIALCGAVVALGAGPTRLLPAWARARRSRAGTVIALRARLAERATLAGFIIDTSWRQRTFLTVAVDDARLLRGAWRLRLPRMLRRTR